VAAEEYSSLAELLQHIALDVLVHDIQGVLTGTYMEADDIDPNMVLTRLAARYQLPDVYFDGLPAKLKKKVTLAIAKAEREAVNVDLNRLETKIVVLKARITRGKKVTKSL